MNTDVTQAHYLKEILPALKKRLKIKNDFAVPRLKKIVINMGVSVPQDRKAREKVLENILPQFSAIAGQKAQISLAKKSIAAFKLREGDPLGVTVTLRGKKMWVFFQKLLLIALPRVKDFRGVSRTAFDGQGNYSLGLREQIIFPEIVMEKVYKINGMNITFVTNTDSDEEAFALLEEFGFAFKKN